MLEKYCRREHLTSEDLKKNKQLIESLSKGHLTEVCDVSIIK